YVYSDPSGATVTVNDKPVAQQTPVILHDLPLGSYRIRIEKAGYLPTDLSLSMSVNEFNPVIVKLKPIPQ
ncbi:MAG: PEGA domain-containing protein, partial [Patescibacteria group bacterium]